MKTIMKYAVAAALTGALALAAVTPSEARGGRNAAAAIGFGAGAESRRPMGAAVVGGMLTSTFLTLIIIPVVYTLFSDLIEKLRRKKAPATLPAEPAPVTK